MPNPIKPTKKNDPNHNHPIRVEITSRPKKSLIELNLLRATELTISEPTQSCDYKHLAIPTGLGRSQRKINKTERPRPRYTCLALVWKQASSVRRGQDTELIRRSASPVGVPLGAGIARTSLSRRQTRAGRVRTPRSSEHARVSHHARASGDDGGPIQTRLPDEQVLQRAGLQQEGADRQNDTRGLPDSAGCAQGGGTPGAEVHILAHGLQREVRRARGGVAPRVRDRYLLESNGGSQLCRRRFSTWMCRAKAQRR